MTDVLALAIGVATTIFERAKLSFWRIANSVAPHARTTLRARSRSADTPLSWHQRRTAETVRFVLLCVAGSSASNACFPFAAQSAHARSP